MLFIEKICDLRQRKFYGNESESQCRFKMDDVKRMIKFSTQIIKRK